MGDQPGNTFKDSRNVNTGSGTINDYGGVQGGVHINEAPTPPPTPTAHPIPSVSDVVGRQRELGELAARFGHASATTIVSEPQSSVCLWGVTGIGKSTLAAYYCQNYKGNYAHICWRDLRRDSTITGLVAAFAALIGADFDPRTIPIADNQALQLVAWLQAASQPCLVVLDNLETVLGRDGQPNQPGWAALLTAAARVAPSQLLIISSLLPSDDAGNELDSYRLGGLSDDAGADLLSRKIQPEQRASIATADLTLATQKAGGHPQALGFLGQLVNGGYPLPTLLADTTLWDDDIATKLLDKVWNDDNLLTIDDRLLLQYVSIYDRPAPLQFRQLVSADDIVGMIANLDTNHQPSGKWDKESVERVMLALGRHSLLNVAVCRYTMHAIVRDYAYKKLADPATHHHAAAAHFRSLYTRDARTDPPRSVAEVQPLLDAFDQLCAAGEWLAAHMLIHGEAFAYTPGGDWISLHQLLDIWSDASRIVVLLGRLAISPAADKLPLQELGVILNNLGLSYKHLGDVQGAISYYERALKIAEQIPDLCEQGATLGNLGLAYADLGDARGAIGYHERALKIAEQIGDLRGQGTHLSNLGLAYADLGDVQGAVGYHERALKIDVQIGDLRGQGADLGNLGVAYKHLGDARRAIGYHERALKINEQIGDLRRQGTNLCNLGIAYADLGEVRKAIGYYERALKIAEQIGDLRDQGNDLGNLASSYDDLGEKDKALELYARAIPISQHIGDLRGEGADWNNLAVLHTNAGSYIEALTCYLRALSLRRRIKDPRAQQTEGNISILRRLADEAAWPALAQQAAAALAADGVALDDALLAEVLNIAPWAE